MLTGKFVLGTASYVCKSGVLHVTFIQVSVLNLYLKAFSFDPWIIQKCTVQIPSIGASAHLSSSIAVWKDAPGSEPFKSVGVCCPQDRAFSVSERLKRIRTFCVD